MVRSKKKQKSLGALKPIILLLFILSMTVLILSLPVWRIKEIIVIGNKTVPSSKISELAGISLDENVFFVNSGEVKRRVKEIPQVYKVDVFPKIPSSIYIKIEERTPFAVFIVDGNYLVVDKEGFIIDYVSSEAQTENLTQGVSGLPVVAGLPKSSIMNGKRINENTVLAVEKSFKVLGSMLSTGRLYLEMKDQGNISIRVNDILKVKIGSVENIDEKLKNLEILLKNANLPISKIEYIDVRLLKAPAMKFR